MTVNELFDFYIKMKKKRERLLFVQGKLHQNIRTYVAGIYICQNYTYGCTKELGIYNNTRDAITQIQQAEFLNFIRESKEYNPYYWMFEFFFEVGMGCGEIIGLTWQNVDFKNKFIEIDH